MILSRGRRYLFIHIPKTGGTSMALALEARAMKDDEMLGDTPKARRRRGRLDGAQARGRLWKHATLCDLDGIVSRDEMRELFVFTMVRNPWDRAVSYYHWLLEQRFDHPAVRDAQAMTFADFLAHPRTRAAFRSHPARSYVSDPDGVDCCDLYIRLEHWKDDAAPLRDHVGFPLDLGHANASDRVRDHRTHYTDATAALVAEDCAEDIARFGYTF
ncbi:sulfotransferase family 2 domain-containing protein [Pseudooceanicola sp. LIPI14-2-Ac024]|uniref:sulfotransferase family 2 domain-containing protein n=1 Tax=Pseudooceanicola sp. LIPI14-2-Ac024 TaxID=3344875 RepID=UPI0035CFDA86